MAKKKINAVAKDRKVIVISKKIIIPKEDISSIVSKIKENSNVNK